MYKYNLYGLCMQRRTASIKPLAALWNSVARPVLGAISVCIDSILFFLVDSACSAARSLLGFELKAIKLFMTPLNHHYCLSPTLNHRQREGGRETETASLSFAFLLFAFYCSQPFLMLCFPFKPFVVCVFLALLCFFFSVNWVSNILWPAERLEG